MSDIRPRLVLLAVACTALLAAAAGFATAAESAEPEAATEPAEVRPAETEGTDVETPQDVAASDAETVTRPLGDPMVVDAVYAVVDKRVITVGEIARKVEPVIEQILESNPGLSEADQNELRRQFFAKIASDMIVKALILKAARDEGLVIDEARVGSQIRRLLVSEGVTLEEYLAKHETTYRELFREVHDDYMFSAYRQAKIVPRVYVSPGEVAGYYEQFKDDAEFLTPAQVRCHEIVLFGHDEERRQKAADALEKLTAGADFAEVAREYSEIESTSRAGGDRGWITRTVINSEKVNAVLFGQLGVGEVSEVIEDEKGFLWIVMITGQREAVRTPLNQAYEKIERRLRRLKIEEETHKYAERLKRKTAVTSGLRLD